MDLPVNSEVIEEIKAPKNLAAKFRAAHGYSLTASKLMIKYGCTTIEEYRVLRNANKKARKKTKPVVEKKAPVVTGKKK